MTERDPRTAAEWATLACACVLLVALIVLVLLQLGGPRDPAAPVAEVGGAPQLIGGLHHVEVKVKNEGDHTAANVQVSAELVVDGEATSADQTIDFLAGGEEEVLVFVFEDDPADGELTVSASSFAVP